MRTLLVVNLKGGVGKTVSAINIAHILAEVHGKRVLLIDNDKQGNTSKFFKRYSEEQNSLGDVLTERNFPAAAAIYPTEYPNLEILPANMSLLSADRQILIDSSRPQQTRLKRALDAMAESGREYDFAVIDNAPDLGMSAINALVACDDAIIPIKMDSFAFDGVGQIMQQIEDIREFNPSLRIVGGFVTMYQLDKVNREGAEGIKGLYAGLSILKTRIRKTTAVDQTTFTRLPLMKYNKRCTAAMDYLKLVEEYLKLC